MNQYMIGQVDRIIKNGFHVCFAYEDQRSTGSKYVCYTAGDGSSYMFTGSSISDVCDKLIFIYETNNWFGRSKNISSVADTEWDDLLKSGYSVELDCAEPSNVVGKLYKDSPSIFNLDSLVHVGEPVKGSSFGAVMDQMVLRKKELEGELGVE